MYKETGPGRVTANLTSKKETVCGMRTVLVFMSC